MSNPDPSALIVTQSLDSPSDAERDARDRRLTQTVAAGPSPDFQALFEASPTPLLVVAPPDWTIVAANDARLRATRTTREEQIGRRLFDVFPDDPEDPSADGVRHLTASLERVVATRSADTMAVQRYAVRGPDERFVERWWAPVNTPVLHMDGSVALILHQVQDVTEVVRLRGDAVGQGELARGQQAVIDRLRASEAALRESEEFSRRVLESSADCIKVLRLDGRLERMSEGGQRALGITDMTTYLGGLWAESFEPDWCAAAHAAVAEAARGATSRFEGSLKTAQGELRWWDSVLTPILGEDGRPERVLAVSRDITDLRVTRDRMREGEARFRNMADNAPVMMWVTDPRGYCTYLNARWYKFTGQPPAAGEGYGWLDAVHPEDRAIAEQAFVSANAERRDYRVDFRLRRADGVYRWTIDTAAARFSPYGEYLGYVGSVIDIDERRDMEERLRASEKRYRLLFESIESGFCVVEVDLEGSVGRIDYRVVEANPAFFRQTGFPETILGRWLREATPNLEEHWYETYGFVAATGKPKRFEQGSDALGRWFDVYAFRTGNSEERRVAILFNDVSARRNAENRLRELNETLERRVDTAIAERDRIWQLSPDLMLVAKVDGTMLSANPAWERLLGWSSEWLAGRNAAEIKHPDDAERTAAELARLAAGGYRTTNFQDRYRHRNGSWRWIAWVCEPEGDLIYCIGRDITAEKTAREALAAAEAARRDADALYRAYFENTAEALFVVNVLEDGGFTIEDLNPAHQASIGLPLAEVRGKRIDQILPPETAALVMEHYRRLIAKGSVYQYRETFELHGRLTYWDTVLVPVRDHDGRIVRLIGASRDLTRQLAAEEQLRQSQKMEAMGQLTGGVAHDFNNLLAPIVGVLDVLQRRGIGGEREQRLIDGAAQSAERAKTLVQRLLAFARRQPLQSSPVDLRALTRGMADLVASTTGPQIRVVVDTPDALPPANADPNQLEMAILNLAVNARDAMPNGGMLRISVEAETVGRQHRSGLKPGRYLCLSVADTGTGMDEATLARAIEPFFSTKGIGKGTGLGLSMVHGLATQLGGALTIQSTPGMGTNVELWLPQGEKLVPTEVTAEEPALTTGSGTVLLVDDEDLVRLSTADMLIELGYSVVEASSAEEALRLLNRGVRPDLVVTDHLMPGMSGTELAAVLRRDRPSIKLLIVSGYADVVGIAPDLPRLTKPFRNAELAASLATLG
ncbi:PAS domain S-box protein [Methylobacterium iners]|uniref:histidine kinase n=1 Tax=Methylobacterium iners TaxID=418707 RepID=A0ABQ4S464_9HYPH|nr:PAS domain S-box protein [Methylobacterium iners]GJD97207.1 Sensor histidine kinase RcsC [Methylobacterium iners]